MLSENIFNKVELPFCHKGMQYALDVVSGKIVANIYVKGACRRFLREVGNTTNRKWIFDPKRAEKYLRIVQKFPHVKGHWGDPNVIIYEPWQCWIWMNIEGFVNRITGFRRFRRAHIEIARGGAKSAMASQCVLYNLAVNDPNGNNISTAATKTSQARIVLDDARAMAEKSKGFRSKFGVKVLKHTIVHEASNSIARALSAEAKTLDGLNDVLAVCDELHAMNRNVFEVITSGMSKRKDSLLLCITTAGSDTDSVGYEESLYMKRLCLGEEEDDTVFAVVYTLDKDDDIYKEENWIKANPGFGTIVDAETFKSKLYKAMNVPADLPNFKIKHLNMWTEGADSFFDLEKWDMCANRNMKLEDFRGVPCRLGIDLASHVDLTARVAIFFKDGKYHIWDEVYVPEDTLKSKDANDKYEEWVKDGWLNKTPGAAISYTKFEEDTKAFAEDHKVLECAYDPWQATQMSQNLSAVIEMVAFKMGVATISEPMKKLDSLIREGAVVHRGSPLFKWCMSNVVAKEDHNGNVYPRKTHKKFKIDVAVATIMALALWLQDDDKESVYETTGLRKL